MKKATTLLAAGALLSLAALVGPETKAATMVFGNPSRPNNGVSYNPSTGYILIPFEIINNNPYTEYSGAVVNSTVGSPADPRSGFQGLYGFGSNSTLYASMPEMLGSRMDFSHGTNYLGTGVEVR